MPLGTSELLLSRQSTHINKESSKKFQYKLLDVELTLGKWIAFLAHREVVAKGNVQTILHNGRSLKAH